MQTDQLSSKQMSEQDKMLKSFYGDDLIEEFFSHALHWGVYTLPQSVPLATNFVITLLIIRRLAFNHFRQ